MLLNFDQLLEKHDVNIKGCLHIGAYIGQEIIPYIKHEINHIIFFEPQEEIFDILAHNVNMISDEKTNVVLVNKAVGNENKSTTMFLSNTPGGIANGSGASSSMLKPKKHLEQYPHITFPKTQDVEMVRIDDFWYFTELDKSYYNFMNIDVQGYELEVLKGAEKTLEGIDYVMAEINRDEVYEGCALVDESDEFLGSYGFQRVETSWEGGTWGDGFYKKIGHTYSI